MASSSCSHSARFSSGQQKLSVIVLLIALHAMAHLNVAAAPAMAIDGSSNGSSAENLQLTARLVQALKDKGGFTAAATLLGAVDLNRLLPGSTTILVPMDDGVTQSGLQFSTFNTALPNLQYHVITRRLAFSDLQQLPEGEMLQTLLPNNTVMITSNSSANFTLDDVPLSHKNLFLAGSTAVHGISGILNFATYGKMRHLHDFQVPAPPGMSPDGAEPAHQHLAPPNSASSNSSSNNETQSSASPAATGVNANSSFSPPSSPASQTAGNASSSGPLSFPIPSPPPKPLNPDSPSTTQAHAPASSQQDSPLQSPFDCNNQPFSLLCSSSSSDQLKPWPSVLLLAGLFLLAKFPAMSRFTFICVVLVIMAATPASGEMKDVSEMLRSRGGFDYAATYLEAIDMNRVLPNRSTVLVPTDAALQATGLIYNTLGAALPTLKYHVVTRHLTFKDLQMLPVGTTLATLLPNSSLLVTSNAASNFTVNDVLLSHPDIFCFNGTAIHGIAGVMNVNSVYSSSTPADADNSGQLPRTPPDLPPQLILPLPELGAPFAAPMIPVSQASMLSRGLNLSRVTLSMLLATSCVLLTFTGHFIPKPCRSHGMRSCI